MVIRNYIQSPVVRLWVTFATVALLTVSVSGCKQQQEMQQKVLGMEEKLAETQKHSVAFESEMKRMSFEIEQLKALVTKLGNVVVELQKSDEDRKKAELEKASKVSSSGKKKSTTVKSKKH